MTIDNSIDDADLIRLTLEGDKSAFDGIVDRYQDKIYRYLLRLLRFNQHDAEDCTADTFLKVYTNLASYKSKYKFSSWIYRIAHNQGVSLIRKKSKDFSVDMTEHDLSTISIETNEWFKSDLEKILNLLKTKDKSILTLFYLEEKTLKEISNILKISENAVATRLNRARNRAKKIVSNNFK